jgi:xanthine dehydrogenase YagT iron-sulfur-binding subunit
VLAVHPKHWDPSRAEHIAIYNKLAASLPGAGGARLLSIGGDAVWRELAFSDDAFTLPVLSGGNEVAALYGAVGRTAVYVIDADGMVQWCQVGSDGVLPDAFEAVRACAESGFGRRGPQMSGREPDGPSNAASRPIHGEPHSTSYAQCPTPDSRRPWSRRDFVATLLGASFALALLPLDASAAPPKRQPRTAGTAPRTTRVTLDVNGREIAVDIEPRVTLLDALREYAGLTGTKKGCDHGQCGACTVHVEGRRVLSCMTFAVMQQGKHITTIEGLASGDQLHPMQRAFIEYDGFQCGYCTSGQIMSATAMVKEPWGAGDEDVREAMSGNICRCGAYPGIVAAIQEVRRGQQR